MSETTRQDIFSLKNGQRLVLESPSDLELDDADRDLVSEWIKLLHRKFCRRGHEEVIRSLDRRFTSGQSLAEILDTDAD